MKTKAKRSGKWTTKPPTRAGFYWVWMPWPIEVAALVTVWLEDGLVYGHTRGQPMKRITEDARCLWYSIPEKRPDAPV